MNINSDLDYFMSIDISNPKFFPILLTELEFCPFRHIDQMTISFNNPISIISGTNRSGKSTILMALACSHLNFQKRNPKNGKLERHTWSSLVKFTNHDMQKSDWTYFITYKKGTTTEKRRGQRKNSTKKWNGIGKKESQYSLRDVIFIDLDRIVPARFFGEKIYSLSKSSTLKSISATHTADIEKYMSYILEENFVINKIAEHLDKDIFKYNNSNEYSSYNAASGEEVLLKIIIDIVEATPKSLILIDEIEMGLHPKIQRRLLDVIRNVSRQTQKQFIITTHSGTVLDSVCPQSRIFIEKSPTGDFKAIHDISVNAALSKMDSKSFPLVDIYCEDNEAKKIIEKGITEVEKCYSINNFSELINIIISGSAENTFRNFNSHMRTYNQKKVKTGYGCVLDGDMKLIKNSKGKLTYQQQKNLHFLYSTECIEKFLTRAYLAKHSNVTIEYYLENEDPHCLLQTIIDNSSYTNVNDVFNYCWSLIIKTKKGKLYLKSLTNFLIDITKHFSPDL